jgi:hypothetical protein
MGLIFSFIQRDQQRARSIGRCNYAASVLRVHDSIVKFVRISGRGL